MTLVKVIPLVKQLQNYSLEAFKGDLAAGLTVGVMLIPQGMAYAMIAGLPPIYGLYASTIPLIVYALLGTSRRLAVGPVAMVSLLTATGIGAIAEMGTEMYVVLSIALAFLVGIIQLLFGVFRLGFLVNFLSHPVLSGFTSGAALIIGLSQLKHLLGIDTPRSYFVHDVLINSFERIEFINWLTFAIGVFGILFIVGLKKVHKAIPGSLLAVLLSILVVWAFDLTNYDVKIVGEVPSGLPTFDLPVLDLSSIQSLLPIALTIAFISIMESIAVAKAIQNKNKGIHIEHNREFVALGFANIGGSLFQSFPVSGGFSRTTVNDQSGAQTGLSAIISSVLIMVTLLFLTHLFYYLPNAILAAVIMVAVFGLVDYKEAYKLLRSDRIDFYMLMATFLCTLFLGIEKGILVGVLLSLGMVIYRSTRPHIAILAKVPQSVFYRNIERFEHLKERADLLILRFDAELYFANVHFFQETLQQQIGRKGKELKAIILNAESINGIDSSSVSVVEELIEKCKSLKIELYFTGVKGPVRDAMVRGKLMGKIGERGFFMSVQQAVNYFDQKESGLKKDGDFFEYTSQVNL